MEPVNPKTARQVWQRVTAPAPPPDRSDLPGLLLSAAETAALYKKLSETAAPGHRSLARKLLQEQQDTLRCLQGLCRLAQLPGQMPRLPASTDNNRERMLRVCYHRSKAALTEYTARTIDPEAGPVFRVLAQRQEQHCADLAMLLGDAP